MIEKYVFKFGENDIKEEAVSIVKREDELLSELDDIWTIQHIEIPFIPLSFKGYIINNRMLLEDDVTPMVDSIDGGLIEVDKVGMMKVDVKEDDENFTEYIIDRESIYINIDIFKELFGNKFLVEDRQIIYYPQGVS